MVPDIERFADIANGLLRRYRVIFIMRLEISFVIFDTDQSVINLGPLALVNRGVTIFSHCENKACKLIIFFMYD